MVSWRRVKVWCESPHEILVLNNVYPNSVHSIRDVQQARRHISRSPAGHLSTSTYACNLVMCVSVRSYGGLVSDPQPVLQICSSKLVKTRSALRAQLIGTVRRAQISTTWNSSMPTERVEHVRSAKHIRVLMYSFDIAFGLGHVRRTRTIANTLAREWPGSSIVILSGSSLIRNFKFRNGVDFVCVPGVEKIHSTGVCTSRALNMSIEEVVGLRRALILQTAKTLNPDIFIVDYKPSGFMGEIVPALQLLRARGCHIVFSARDIIDEPSQFLPDWNRYGAIESLERYYDEIWVHGLEEIYRPFAELNVSARLVERITYTGYLRRELPQLPTNKNFPNFSQLPFILVTAGGGGDGQEVIDWVIAAYEADPGMELPALIVFGSHMNGDRRRDFMERIQRHSKLDAISFDTEVEILMSKATAIVAMCGYNTFCEILSFDKPSLIVPRRRSDKEQLIRAVQAEQLGLITYIVADESGHDPLRMATALRALPGQKAPSSVTIPGLLDGLDVICKSVSRAVGADQRNLTLEKSKMYKDDSLSAVSIFGA